MWKPWRAQDEYAVCAYYASRPAEALEITQRLLATATLPPADRARMEGNIAFYRRGSAA